jgi:hypothetical protein
MMPNKDLAISSLFCWVLVSLAMFFPFLVMNISSLATSVRYLPILLLYHYRTILSKRTSDM